MATVMVKDLDSTLVHQVGADRPARGDGTVALGIGHDRRLAHDDARVRGVGAGRCGPRSSSSSTTSVPVRE